MKKTSKDKVKIPTDQELFVDPDKTYVESVKIDEITLIAIVRSDRLERRLKRKYYGTLLQDYGVEITRENMNQLLFQIESGAPDFQVHGLDTLKARERVMDAAKQGVEYYAKNTKNFLTQVSDSFFLETFLRGFINHFRDSGVNIPTQSQVFGFFAEKEMGITRQRMGIKQERGNKKKRNEVRLNTIAAEHDSLRNDLMMAKRIFDSYEEVKKKNRHLKSEKEWEAYKDALLQPLAHLSPNLLRRIESGGRLQTPTEIALEEISKKYDLGLPKNVRKLLPSKK